MYYAEFVDGYEEVVGAYDNQPINFEFRGFATKVKRAEAVAAYNQTARMYGEVKYAVPVKRKYVERWYGRKVRCDDSGDTVKHPAID